MTLPKQHRAFFIIIAFAAVLFLGDIWAYKEFVRAESYFALGSRLMIEQSDWLTPHAPDELALNKPPLTYWLIGVSYKLFGANYGSARLPSVLAALAVLAIIYLVAVRFWGIPTGLISVALLGSSYLFLSFARMAMSDMLLTLFVTISFACFMLALDNQESAPRGFVMLGYVALALGVLAKGPVALALVAIPFGLELLLRRDRRAVKRLRLIHGMLVFALIAAPYFALVYARLGAEPLRFFFFGENIQRFTGQIYGGSGRPFWSGPLAFFSDFAPWSLLIFVAIWFDWRGRGLPESKGPAARVPYLWLVWTILLFSLSSFKLDYYLLPSMPAAALIIAPVIANAEKLPRFGRGTAAAFLVFSSAVILAVALLSLKAAAVLSVQSASRFLPVVTALLGLASIVFTIARLRTWQTTLVLTATIWATMLTMQWSLLPSFARYLPATQLAAAVPAGSVVYTSWSASDWANCLEYNLPPPHRVERLIDDGNNLRLQTALKSDPESVAIIWEREYATLSSQQPTLKILAQVETFGHGGLSLKIIRDPQRERLLVVGH